MAEVAQLRARQVAAAGRQMDAARIRIAALQRQLRWDRVEALVASRLAPQLCNALSLSKAGQVRDNSRASMPFMGHLHADARSRVTQLAIFLLHNRCDRPTAMQAIHCSGS